MTGPGAPDRPAGFDLTGRAVLLTEATTPIGRALAAGFLAAGADLFVSARRAADLAAARVADPVLAALPGDPADLTRPGEADRLIDRAVATLGRLDVLAGSYQRAFAKPITSILDGEYARVLDLNLRPAFAAARAAVPHLAASGSGRILLLSSGLAVRGLANGSVFCAAQGALAQLIRALALELAPQGIRVNGLGPGWIEGEPGADPAALTRFVPTRRFDTLEDLVPLAVYLASSASDLVTGQTFYTTGGLLARTP